MQEAYACGRAKWRAGFAWSVKKAGGAGNLKQEASSLGTEMYNVMGSSLIVGAKLT